jgi:hypothetical protein
VLYRRKPQLDTAAVLRALGPDAHAQLEDGMLKVRIGERVLRVVVADNPVPREIFEPCLQVAHLPPEQKAELAAHGAHALVVHEEEQPDAEGLVALYQLAGALRGEGDAMLGVANPITGMALTTAMLDETLEPEFVEAVHASPAESLALWLGFVKLFKPDGTTWLVTRGASLVGLRDLAWLAKDLGETDDVFAMFAGILDYAYGNGVALDVGDTIEFGDRALVLRAPYEHVKDIGDETLVVEAR